MVHMAEMREVFDDHGKKTGGKWTNILLYIISRYPVRFNKIKQLLPDITSRTLSLTLGKMQSNGLIYKESDLYKNTNLGTLTLTTVLDYIENVKKLESDNSEKTVENT